MKEGNYMSKYPFPKADLHLHLDGSFHIARLYALAVERGVELPGGSEEGYRAYLNKHADAESVNEYLEMFEGPTQVLQDHDSLAQITEDLIIHLEEKGVRYAEIRFAPQIHTRNGMTQSEAVQAVLDGRKSGLEKTKNIDVNIITCMMSFGPETVNWDQNMETVEVCREYFSDEGVVALDLAGAEGFVPLSNFGPLFAKAREYGLNIICHAGDSQDWETVRDAIDFGVTRVGHGHHIYENPELVRLAAKKGIALEICPTSNIQCKTRETYARHPAKNLLQMGIPVTINTDNMVMARVSLDDEYDHCLNEMGFTWNDLIQMNINSVNASFAKQEIKDKLIAELKTYFK